MRAIFFTKVVSRCGGHIFQVKKLQKFTPKKNIGSKLYENWGVKNLCLKNWAVHSK